MACKAKYHKKRKDTEDQYVQTVVIIKVMKWHVNTKAGLKLNDNEGITHKMEAIWHGNTKKLEYMYEFPTHKIIYHTKI
jgi:hypothetical protein